MLATKLFRTANLLVLSLLSAPLAPADAADPPRSWPADQYAPVSLRRIALLPTNDQPAWKAYWESSQALARTVPPRSAPEFSPTQPIAGPAKGGLHSKGLKLKAPPDWYATDAARTIADRVVGWQTAAGGWTKGNDYTQPLPAEPAGNHDAWSGGTFDNEATYFEMRFLVRVINSAEPDRSELWRRSYLRGLRYILSAQYPNGGFPQIYPLAGSYHDAVTFNDNATTHLLELLRDVAQSKPELGFVPETLRAEAARRLRLGVDCILATQLRAADGTRTVWCQQYDALTLQPCAARNFEPIAATAFESAELCSFLMTLPQPSPAVVRAVDDALAWFRRTAIPDITWGRFTNDAQVVAAPGAPPLWARLYELNTDKPIFADRDRTIHYAVSELSSERRAGYAWYGDWPAIPLAARKDWAPQGRRARGAGGAPGAR